MYRKFPSPLVCDHLGLVHDNVYHSRSFVKSSTDRGLSVLFYGKFKNIIDVLFHSENPVDLCSALGMNLSSHASPEVLEFVNNFLLKSIPAIKGAPDAETAFETIIPRDCYTRSRIAPYLDKINEFIVDNSKPESDV